MPQLTVCPSCAEHLEPEDNFCGNCGTSLAAPTAPNPRAPASPPAGTAARRSAASPHAASPHGASPAEAVSPMTHTPGVGPSAPCAPAADVAEAAARGAEPGAPRRAYDVDYGLAPPVAKVPAGEIPAGEASRAEADDYGLAPPTRAATPARGPSQALPAPTGVSDPREALLAREADWDAGGQAGTGPDAAAPEPPACVACGIGAVDTDGYCEHCGHAQPRRRDHMEQELARVSAVTDRGLRHHRNEDAFAVAVTTLPDGTPAAIAVVCDGVSSSSRPDDASEAASVAASDTLRTALSCGTAARQAMREALLAASESVNALAEGDVSDPENNAPACTFVSAVTTGELLTVGWVGDSRAYWVPDDRTADSPARLTEDDSWAAAMIEAGLLSEEDAYADERAHAITGWLGADAVEADPHTASFEPDRPGIVVVCTDGLWNYAESAAELAAVVPPDARTRPLHCARTLVGVALDGGGHDNITVAVIPFPAPA